MNMAKYTSSQFSTKKRPKKALIEKSFYEIMKQNGIRGSCLILSGPNLKKHYDISKALLTKSSKMVVPEINDRVYKNLLPKAKKINNEKIIIKKGDIFDIFKYYKKGKFSLIDLDFCVTIPKLIKQDITSKLFLMFSSTKLRNRVGLIVTFSGRGDKNYRLNKFLLEQIIDGSLNHRYRIMKQIKQSYRDTQPMETWLYILIKKQIIKRGCKKDGNNI